MRSDSKILARLFSKVFGDENITEIQKSEMKKSFYAGATAAIGVMLQLSNENISKDQGAQIFEGMRKEVVFFVEKLVFESINKNGCMDN